MLDPYDHRSLAHRLDLLHLQDEAPGMVFWHPRGWTVYRLLEEAARRRVLGDAYVEVRTPQILRQPIWQTSGHWAHFAGGMFRLDDGGVPAAVKPVSCPGHVQIVTRTAPSYRDLPVRLAEFGLVHRDEPGGTLHGLFRLRQFTQDDGHVFCREDQVAEELDRFCRALMSFYQGFGLPEPSVLLSTRPADWAGDVADWDQAERRLRESLERLAIPCVVQQGAGAFYGPKIEFALQDRTGRPWQCGTIQLDAVMPQRFGLRYQDASGQRQPLVLLHRALYGSLERFAGLLLEHHRGRLPAWLAPVQVRVIPVDAACRDYADTVRQAFARAGLRVDEDVRDQSLARRVRAAHEHGVPVAAVVGAREQQGAAVTIRTGRRTETRPLADAVRQLVDSCAMPAL